MPRKPWTPAEAKFWGRKGGQARRNIVRRTPEYTRGYNAGWVACERFWRRQREQQKRAS